MTRVAGRRPSRVLWHFTCDHGRAGIGTHGTLRPNQHVLIPDLPPVVWLTSNPRPAREAVGLASQHLTCDRLAHRYKVADSSRAFRWTSIRAGLPAEIVDDLERYGEPSTWWLSFEPVKAAVT